MRKLFLTLGILLLAVLTCSADRRKAVVEDLNVLKVRGVMESYKSVAEGLDSRLAMYAESGLTHSIARQTISTATVGDGNLSIMTVTGMLCVNM